MKNDVKCAKVIGLIRMIKFLVPVMLLSSGVVPTLAQQPQPAATVLNTEMASAAEKLKLFLDGKGQDAIVLGAFCGPERFASGGPGIRRALTEELERLGVRVEKRAGYEVKADYLAQNVLARKRVALAMKFHVADRAGQEALSFSRGIFEPAAILAILGATGQLDPGTDEKSRDDLLKKALVEPKFAVSGPRISTPGSPYALEILVKTDGKFQPRPARVENGQAFVSIERDETFAIKLINDSPHDAAVQLSIDGLSVFAFSELKDPQTHAPRYTNLVIPADQNGLVQGWHINDATSDAFVVTSYARGAVAELGGCSGNVGTINACFAAAWPKGTEPPADEAEAVALRNTRAAEATGRGARIDAKYATVERVFGVVRSSISVRYAR